MQLVLDRLVLAAMESSSIPESRRIQMTTEPTATRRLYKEGDPVVVQYQIFPGPHWFTAIGKVVRCVSSTYYEVEYVDHREKRRVKRFMRSQLP